MNPPPHPQPHETEAERRWFRKLAQSFLPDVRVVEGGVESEDAFRLRRTQELELEKLSRLPLRHILRRELETKALVVRWIASEHAPQRTTRRDLIKPRANELTTDALALVLWRD